MSRTYRTPSDVLVEVVDGEAVLLNLQTGQYFRLNRTGTQMWDLLRASRETDAVVGVIERDFGVDRTTVEADLAELVRALIDRGLLVQCR